MSPYTLMVDSITVCMWMWLLFLGKHLVADYLYQTRWMIENKGKYFHPGGWVHAGFHGILTVGVLAGMFWIWPFQIGVTTVIMTVVGLGFAETFVHHGIDYMKMRLSSCTKCTPDRPWFWQLFGIDQTLHGICYVLISAVWWMVIIWNLPAAGLIRL